MGLPEMNQSSAADKILLKNYALEVVGIIGVRLCFPSNPMIDCSNTQLQIPKRNILLSFEHKRDRSYCSTCYVPRKCVPFGENYSFHTLCLPIHVEWIFPSLTFDRAHNHF